MSRGNRKRKNRPRRRRRKPPAPRPGTFDERVAQLAAAGALTDEMKRWIRWARERGYAAFLAASVGPDPSPLIDRFDEAQVAAAVRDANDGALPDELTMLYIHWAWKHGYADGLEGLPPPSGEAIPS